MSSPSPAPAAGTAGAPLPVETTRVAIVGAGIVGLFNALQLAKRGLEVTLVDDVVNQKRSFKVGESLLVFSNPFLRTIGGLDEFLNERSVPKMGVWFVHGAEGARSFDETNEWALERTLPADLEESFDDPLLYRAGVEDAQIVRPEAEDEMRRQVHEHPNVTFLDSAKVKEIDLAEEGEDRPHRLRWEDRSEGTSGHLDADWVLDCAGRVRLLAKRMGHLMEDEIQQDGFQTTAVWGQFAPPEGETFGDTWLYEFADKGDSQRQRCTMHLWGRGYWIWIITLSEGRLSVGITFDQSQAPEGDGLKEKFWNVLGRYPLLEGMLSEDNLLEFRAYRNVQYMTDTVVSPRRYAMAGDSASIIDAYYSQGMSHAFVTSWHIANVIEEDLRQDHIDHAYVERINESLREDWRIVRNMVSGKFTSAIEDGRYFLLSHLLDLLTFIAIGTAKVQITRWLVDTGGDSRKEERVHGKIRRYLKKRLFYSKGFWPLAPTTVRRWQGRLQHILTRRALWRLENGVEVPRIKCIVRFNAGPIPFWRVFAKGAGKLLDISPSAIEAKPPKFMQVTGRERFPIALQLARVLTLLTFLILFVYDGVATSLAKGVRTFTRPFRRGAGPGGPQGEVARPVLSESRK